MKKTTLFFAAAGMFVLIFGLSARDVSAHAKKKPVVSRLAVESVNVPTIMEPVRLAKMLKCPSSEDQPVPCLTVLVKKGETLSHIAARAPRYVKKITVEGITFVNPERFSRPLPKGFKRSEDYLREGETLNLPFVRESDLEIAIRRVGMDGMQKMAADKEDEIMFWKTWTILATSAFFFVTVVLLINMVCSRKGTVSSTPSRTNL